MDIPVTKMTATSLFVRAVPPPFPVVVPLLRIVVFAHDLGDDDGVDAWTGTNAR
jgi:hypothetical protein